MYKNATKCNETIGKWCKTKHGASKIIDTFEMYQAAPPYCLNASSRLSNCFIRAFSASILFEYGLLSFESLFRAVNAFISSFPKHGSNKPIRMPYVKYEGKSTVSNTGWPSIRIKRALPRNFPCLWHEEMHRWTHRVPHNYWASTQ
jgi:hypothetical protein